MSPRRKSPLAVLAVLAAATFGFGFPPPPLFRVGGRTVDEPDPEPIPDPDRPPLPYSPGPKYLAIPDTRDRHNLARKPAPLPVIGAGRDNSKRENKNARRKRRAKMRRHGS